jgi:hypothetical protein
MPYGREQSTGRHGEVLEAPVHDSRVPQRRDTALD